MSFLPGMMPGWARGSAVFDPLSAFSGGENGFIFDPSQLSSIFQGITGGSTAVSADADPVGYITDLTGNGHHASASAADTTRALYRTSGGLSWLAFDGSNDKYNVIPGTLLNNKAGCTLIFAGRGGAAGADRRLLLVSNGLILNNARFLLGKNAAGVILPGGRRLDANSFASVTSATAFDGTDRVVQADAVYSSSDFNLYVNGSLDSSNTGFQTDGNTSATDSLGIGLGHNCSAAQFWLGRLYWLMLIDRILTSTERADYTTYAGAKMGLSL